jgi:hypothetical protein
MRSAVVNVLARSWTPGVHDAFKLPGAIRFH